MEIDTVCCLMSGMAFPFEKMPRVSGIYHSNNCWKVVQKYLDHMQIEKCDVESIVSTLWAS